MTTIVAIQGRDSAVVGCDSRCVEESTRVYSVGRGSAKIVKNGDYLFGVAGDFRAINILSYVFTPPAPKGETGIHLDRFVTKNLIPAMRTCFESQGYATKSAENKEQAEQGSTILVVLNGTVYEIGGDYSWVRDSSGVYAFGTGGAFALGCLLGGKYNFSTMTIERTKKVVTNALRVSAQLDQNTSAPFHIFVQQNH
jgi:ATP-dependent protease HslVU (ClpYQ) peptidase subunit